MFLAAHPMDGANQFFQAGQSSLYTAGQQKHFLQETKKDTFPRIRDAPSNSSGKTTGH